MIAMPFGQFTAHDKTSSRHQPFNYYSQSFVQPKRNWQVGQKIMGQLVHENVLGRERVNVRQSNVGVTSSDKNTTA